jgi:hypothetical protein
VVISDETALSNGERLLMSGVDLGDFEKTRGVLVGHDASEIVAWCADLEICGGQLIACAQFPPAGVSRKADRALEAVRRGELPAASVGYSAIERRTGADGVTEVTRWPLREWSFCKAGGNRLCRVLSVGGVPLAPANDPLPLRKPDYLTAESPAHYVAALREFDRLKRVALWAN